MGERVGVCLVGCGWIGEVHAEQYLGFRERVRLFVCDQVEDRARNHASKFGAEGWFTDFDEALARSDIAATDICLPHSLHEEAAAKAARAGKHILLEKPIARTLEEADQIIREAGRAGVKLMIAENYRFEPAVVKAKELVEQGVVGKPFLFQISSLQFSVPSGWRRRRDVTGGGVLIDRGVHMVDVLYNLGGEVESLWGLTTHRTVLAMEGEDTVLALLRYRSGAVGELVVSWGMRNPPRVPWLIVHGDKGTIFEVPDARWLRQELNPQLNVYSTEVAEYAKEGGATIDLPRLNPFAEEIRHFLDCLATGREPRVTGEVGRKDLEIVLAIYRSAETGEAVKLSS